MVCKIKFNNPLLDSYERYPLTKEGYHNLLVEKLNALFLYCTDGKEKLPDNLPLSVISVILKLADLSEIPGLMNDPKPVGQPSRWNGEDGFILSARVQIYLLKHPSDSVRKAVIKNARKLFPSLSDDGIYHRYQEELKNEHSYISIAKHRIDHLKEKNNYDNLSASRKEDFIKIFKKLINETFSQIFPDSKNILFKDDPYLYEVSLQKKSDPSEDPAGTVRVIL